VQWVIDYLPQEAVVRVVTSGPMRLEENLAFIADALAVGKQHGASRFLVDHRNMTTAMSIEELFDLPVTNARMGVDPSQRAAVVYSPDSPSRDDFFFYDARNRGKGIRSIRLFTDIQHAMDWLAETD
jgi:hypothetical protein